MTINYRKVYLTDGTQVKITEELFRQLGQWELEGYEISFQYTDMLKREDNETINANRVYYSHNISLDAQMLKDHINPVLLHDKSCCIDDDVQSKDMKKQIMKVLSLCTETQRRRFIKHYYLDLSYAEIAKQENCYKNAIKQSVDVVVKLLINCEQL